MNDHDRREELLHLLLDRDPAHEARRTEALLAARNDPAAARILARYDEILAGVRAEDRRAEWPADREKALVKRILAQTTRQDLRWRGDARLVLAFVRDGLRRSPALRVLAASVMLCFFASSFFAWLALRVPEPDTFIFRTAPAAEEPPIAESEDEATAPEATDPADVERLAWERSNLRRRDRYLLDRWPAAVTEAPEAPLAVRLLVARSAELAGAPPAAWVDTEELLTAAVGLERVLAAELLLDRVVRKDGTPAILPRLLHRLSRTEAAPQIGGPVAELARRAVRRAQAYGSFPEEDPSLRARGFPAPLDDEWCARVLAVLPAALRDHPALAPWRR